jgi:CheY-like chemotaxis protein
MKEVVLTGGEREPESPNVRPDHPRGYLVVVDEARIEALNARSLPFASEPALLQGVQAPGRDAVKRQARILVVDDIETNRDIVEAYLTSGGYSVDVVSGAAEAIRILESKSYDVVLMDIQMPVMDGVAATRCIRSLPNTIKDIPIIAMTANVLPEQVRSYLSAGMNGHVGKPIDRASLYSSVQRCLPGAERNEVDVGPIWLVATSLENGASTRAAAK